ncbi:MAG TPA: hypothetical protein VNA17_05925 [Pyrinomonadaceae bacterium]|nr:hypothetical protein [Pyrinomonadaceae bacterium]
MEKNYTIEELHKAFRAIASMIGKVEKVRGKNTIGISQRTLIERRLKALRIASKLIAAKIEELE